MAEYKIELYIDTIDFEQTFSRKPKDENEFEWFCFYCEKGLRNGHIDWKVLFQCAKEAVLKNN